MGRLELRMSDELLARLDEARGLVPRGTFVKAALEKELGAPLNAGSLTPAVPPMEPVYEGSGRPSVRAPGKPSWVQPIPKGK